MKHILKILGAILLVAALAGSGYWLYRTRIAATPNESTGDTLIQIVDVQEGNLSSAITVVGELASVQSADLTFSRLNGTTTLLTLNVSTGNIVTEGQGLATVDPASYEQTLDQAKGDLQAAEKKLAELKTPATALDIAKADLAIAQAKYQRQQAQDALDELLNPDIAQLKTAVTNAQTALAQAQADLTALQNDDATETQLSKLRDAEATASTEHARLAGESYTDSYHQDRLQVAFNKMMNAADARVTAEVQAQVNLLKAEMQVRKAESTLADAQEAFVEAQTDGDALALAKAELAVQTAEVALLSAQEARAELDEGADTTTLAAAQADLDKKRLTLADAEADLAGATLTAPFDGTVLQTYTTAGDTIAANTQIIALANLNDLQILASIDETTVRRVAAGQPAHITFDALPGQTFTGQVASVPLQGSLQGGVTVYEVPIAITGQKPDLLIGMTANVQIQTGQVENALLVPTMALQKVNGLYQVRIPNATDPNGEPESVPVEVGLSDGTYTQILRGLNPGDQVVVELSTSEASNFNMRGFGIMGGPMGGSVEIRSGAPPGR